MLATDADALMCDLAETYHIYDYQQLPPSKVAVFSVGLKDTSRIKMKLAGQNVPLDTLMVAGIVDRLSILVWRQTEDGHKGINRPAMVTDTILGTGPKEDMATFCTGEDFEKARNEIIKQIEAGGGEE